MRSRNAESAVSCEITFATSVAELDGLLMTCLISMKTCGRDGSLISDCISVIGFTGSNLFLGIGRGSPFLYSSGCSIKSLATWLSPSSYNVARTGLLVSAWANRSSIKAVAAASVSSGIVISSVIYSPALLGVNCLINCTPNKVDSKEVIAVNDKSDLI